MKIVARYPLPGSEEPHGFYIDAPQRLIAAGFGDMIGKITSLADWKLGSILWDEPYDTAIASTLAVWRIISRTDIEQETFQVVGRTMNIGLYRFAFIPAVIASFSMLIMLLATITWSWWRTTTC